VDACVVNHGGDERVAAVVPAQQLHQQQQHLPTYDLVTVHVPDVLELRLTCRE